MTYFDWRIVADQGNHDQLCADRGAVSDCCLGSGARAKQPAALCLGHRVSFEIPCKIDVLATAIGYA